MTRCALILLLTVAACGDEASPPGVDAMPVDAAPDATPGTHQGTCESLCASNECPGAAFEACVSSCVFRSNPWTSQRLQCEIGGASTLCECSCSCVGAACDRTCDGPCAGLSGATNVCASERYCEYLFANSCP